LKGPRNPAQRQRSFDTFSDRIRILEPQLLDLAGDGVAADPEQLGRLNTPPAGGGQGTPDEDALEILAQRSKTSPGFWARERSASAIRASPQLAGCSRVGWSLSSGGRSATSTVWPGAITVSQ
jgi:hypothetical protein